MIHGDLQAVPFLSPPPARQKGEWITPPDLFEAIEACWGPFDLDLAASAANALLPEFLTVEDDALSMPWGALGDLGFCNPPYGRAIHRWVAKFAYEASLFPAEAITTVALIPASVGSRWWRRYVLAAREIVFLSGRVHFGGAETGAPFDSAVVVWRPAEVPDPPRQPFDWPHWRAR